MNSNNNRNTVSIHSKVVIWDIHDFKYRLSDEVDNAFVRSLAIVRLELFHPVTFAALSLELSVQLVVSNASANAALFTSPANKATNNPLLDVQMYVKQKLYLKDHELKLAATEEKLRLTDFNDTALNKTDEVNAQFLSRGVKQHQNQNNAPGVIIVICSHIGEDGKLLL